MSSWQDRAARIRERRVARGLPVDGSAVSEPEDDTPKESKRFNYAADIEEHPFKWWPGESMDSPIGQVSPDDLGTCRGPGCGQPVRKLKPFAEAQPRCCPDCITIPAGVVIDQGHVIDKATGELLWWPGQSPAGLAEICKPPLTRSPEEARRVVAQYLSGAGAALEEFSRRKRKEPRSIYTMNQKREAVFLYRNTDMAQTAIAEKIGVPVGTVKKWISRYQDDPFYQRLPAKEVA